MFSKKRQKVVKNKPKRNSFHFYFCTNNSTPTGNAPIKNDFNYADSESAISTVSSIDSVEYAFPVVEEDDEVEKLDPEDKVELPSSKRLTPLSIMVVDTISAVRSRTLLKVLFDSRSSSSPRIFDKPKGGQGSSVKTPAVYFSFAVSSDIPPEEIMAWVTMDWNILGGTRLSVKTLGVFDTVTPMVIYFLWNEGHGPTILNKLQCMLSEFLPILSGGEQEELPSMTLRKQLPRIPGQVSTDFQNLSFRAQMARRAWHIEVEKRHVDTLKKLVSAAKEAGSVGHLWGRQAHISEAADNDTSPGELKRYIKFAQRHVNFHCSMTCDDLRGIVNLDATVTVSTGEEMAEISLRQVLLFKFKLADGTSLIAEVHQRGPMGAVDVIVPNIPEAEAMLLMMNRHFPAFCLHYLVEKGMAKKLVMDLLRESCCPTLVGSIKECKWESATKTITTAAQAEEDARLREMENASWYRDEFGTNMLGKLKHKKSYADAEALYALDGDRSVKTLHARNDPKPSAPKKRKGDDLTGGNGLDSDISNSSPEHGASDDDISMDSASISKSGTLNGKGDAEQGTGRVHFTRRSTTSSADGSAPSPSAGGG